MAKGQQAGVTHQQVDRGGQQRVAHQLDQKDRVGHQRRQQQGHQRQHQQDGVGAL